MTRKEVSGKPSSDSNSNNKAVKLDRWVHSISTMLGCVENELVEACSISFAPEHLGKSKMEAYRPKVTTIGPLHRGASPDLIYMEDIKWSCMLHLLHRTSNPVENLERCSRTIFDLDGIVRASYNVVDIKFNRYDLSKIMLLDGCFLLELLICRSKELNTTLKCNLTSSPSPGAGVRKRELVLSDLTVVGNQIPFIILVKLATLLFPHVFPTIKAKAVDKGDKAEPQEEDDEAESEEDDETESEEQDEEAEYEEENDEAESEEEDGLPTEEAMKKIKQYVLSLLGYTSGSRINDCSDPVHVLELVHSFLTLEMEQEKSTDASIDMESDESEDETTSRQQSKVKDDDKKTHVKLKLKRCTTRLEAAGVEINPPPMKCVCVMSNNRVYSRRVRFDLSIRFCRLHGKLEIPPLHITETTEVKWRNFIAWELNRSDNAKCTDCGKSGISCKFIWYALFFQGLICCVHDIQLLRDREVIVVHKVGEKELMSNEDLLNFFRDITEGIHHDQIVKDSCFSQLFLDLNSYPSTVNCTIKYSKIICHLGRRVLTAIWYFCRNSIEILLLDHISTRWKFVLAVAAILTTLLTYIKAFSPNLFH